jgi:thiol-disulfide isomerase/thioredoxin
MIPALAAALSVLYGMGTSAVHASRPAALKSLIADAAPRALPPVAFTDFQGRAVALSSLRGRLVILNLWATWCEPCVRELPALARLSAALGPQGVRVVAVSEGHEDAAATQAFLKAHGAANLTTNRDAGLAMLTAFGSQGLPFSVVIDVQGREIARAAGPMAWDDKAAIAYFRALAAAS